MEDVPKGRPFFEPAAEMLPKHKAAAAERLRVRAPNCKVLRVINGEAVWIPSKESAKCQA